MTKGNFIDYITSDDPNKYPSDGVYTDGYYYKKVTKSTGSTTPTEPEPTLPDAVDGALTFYSEAPFRMCITNKKKNWDGTLYYSLDNSNWSEWNGEFIEGTNGIIYMRGVGNTYLNTGSVGRKGAFHFETNTGCFIHCIGSMDNLLDYTTTPTMASYCYYYMFFSCANLITAPMLPATTLSDNCYRGMFSLCINLTTAPELPATVLTQYCYRFMFNNCTSLINPPKLPATILAEGCYMNMLQYCTSLTTAPALPATTLADSCYSRLFKGCTSLTTAPQLPATTLANNCYYEMFYDCVNLTSAPELPATTLADKCYYYMFSSCANLTILPELPATTLANNCYQYMFTDCTNIKLSETQTGEYQTTYRIPTSGTGTVGTDSLTDMFKSTGGTFTGTPTINTIYYLSTSNTVV